jgi:triacylglycerol lipase
MILIVAVLALVCAIALLTHAFFWYEAANSPYRKRLQEISQGHVARILLRSILSSVVGQLMVLFFLPLQLWRALWRPSQAPNQNLQPVFIVHGLYHNASAWVLYRWWLKKAGYANIYCWYYSSFEGSFDQIVNDFNQWVQEIIAERHPGQQAIMIGHSLGGLIIRAHINNPETARQVTTVVTLGTPHQGSKLAALGIGRLAQSLLYQGLLSQRLENAVPPKDVKRLAVVSPTDNMVLPPPDAWRSVQEGWEYLETPPLCHVALLYHWPTAKKVLQYLGSPVQSGQDPQ